MDKKAAFRLFILLILLVLETNTLLCSKVVHSSENKDTLNYDTLNIIGNQNIPASFFIDRYLHNDIEQYLDNYQEFVICQTHTTGDFSKPNPFTFSILGNSFKWNKYYVNNFRIDDHYFSGNALHKLNMTNFDLSIDIWNSSVSFLSDTNQQSVIGISYNHGGNFGGVAPGTENLIHLFHRTAREALYMPIEEQRRIKNTYNIYWSDNIKIKGKSYRQKFSVNTGSRINPDFDYKGISRFYNENYTQFNLNGQLPTINKKLFDNSCYLLSYNQRDNMFSEYYYNSSETAKLNSLNLSLFGSKNKTINNSLSTGFNVSYKNIRHNEIEFSRNIVDHDGEGFEPWYPDANEFEISYALYKTKKISEKLMLKIDMYNSIIHFQPSVSNFNNPFYSQSTDTSFISLYVYEWNSKQFTSGLLENTFGLNYNVIDNKKFNFSLASDITLDGFILKNTSYQKLNWQADARAFYSPSKFIQIAIITGKKRVSFNFDQIRFISDNYMNGNIYYWNDANNDHLYQTNEKSDLFTTTGGKYHTLNSDIKQTGYYYFEIPVKIKIKKHNIVLSPFYRQYVNTWQTYYTNQSDNKGYYTSNKNETVYLLENGETNYIVENLDNNKVKQATSVNSFLFNNPFSSGITLKYQFNSKRLLLSASWTAHTVSGFGALGNGVLHNNIGVLSETTANPNTYINYYGRLDSDRAYIARFITSYKFSNKFSLVFQLKYADGQPFADFNTYLYNDGKNTQIAIWENYIKGDNIISGEFGTRKDAFFNTVLRGKYTTNFINNKLNINLSIYNIYDFGTELAEYTFPPIKRKTVRYVLELNIPRGVMFSLEYVF